MARFKFQAYLRGIDIRPFASLGTVMGKRLDLEICGKGFNGLNDLVGEDVTVTIEFGEEPIAEEAP
jgi:hypothetical protein